MKRFNKRTGKKDPEASDGMISSSIYDLMVMHMPIASVEAIIVLNNSLLFLRRRNSPARGQWWFPGGRIRRGESLEEALFREVKEETGLDVTKHELVCVYSRIFPERHDIAIVFLCRCSGRKVILNNEHSEHKLFKTIPKGIHPYLLEAIRDSSWQMYC